MKTTTIFFFAKTHIETPVFNLYFFNFCYSLPPHKPTAPSHHRTSRGHHRGPQRTRHLKLSRRGRTGAHGHVVQRRTDGTDGAPGRAIPSRPAARGQLVFPASGPQQEGIGRGCLLVRSNQRSGEGEEQERHADCCW